MKKERIFVKSSLKYYSSPFYKDVFELCSQEFPAFFEVNISYLIHQNGALMSSILVQSPCDL